MIVSGRIALKNQSPKTLPSRARRWVVALKKPVIWVRASKVGLPVGILQVIVNQGDAWASHAVGPAVIIKSILSPLLSFSIALCAAAATDVQEQIRSQIERT